MNDYRRRYAQDQHEIAETKRARIAEEVRALRPVRCVSYATWQHSLTTGGRPANRRGAVHHLPDGKVYTFRKSEQPSDELIDTWERLWREAEAADSSSLIASTWKVCPPGTVVGNTKHLLDGVLLRNYDAGHWFGEPNVNLLDDDEIEHVRQLTLFWNANPDARTGVVQHDGTIEPID